MLHKLSWLVPVRMRSTYRELDMAADHPDLVQINELPRFRSTWWQWRGRVWGERRVPA